MQKTAYKRHTSNDGWATHKHASCLMAASHLQAAPPQLAADPIPTPGHYPQVGEHTTHTSTHQFTSKTFPPKTCIH